MGDMRAGDIGVVIDFDTGEDISDASAVSLILRSKKDGTGKTFTGAVSGTDIVRYTTAAATDVPDDGTWTVQVEVTQPTKTRRSTHATMTVDEAL